MLPVVRFLQLAAAGRFFDGPLHGIGDRVGIQDHRGVHIPRRTTDSLHQRRLAPQKTLLVGIEDGDQRDLGQVEAFPQQIHPHQRVELALPQLP